MSVASRLMATVLIALPVAASAQTTKTNQDLEYREVTIEDKGELTHRARFESEIYEYNNLDMRPLDEISDQAILDSDDRGSFAFTGASIELGYRVDPQIRFVIAGSHRGLWGNDQLGGTNRFGGWMYFNAMYADLDTAADNGIRFRVGRQFYRMGALGGARDYILADVLDMVRVDVPLGTVGSLTLIPINVAGSASANDGANFVGYIGQSAPETFNFRGDTLTRRYGGTVNLHPEDKPFEAVAYTFYSDLGAAGTGSDISYDGLIGNFSDNDWVLNYGLRGNVKLGPATLFGHFDGSAGVDRKELVANDVDTNGFAYGGGVRIDTSDPEAEDDSSGFRGELSYFDAWGPAYAENGLQYSHGYVGMKAQQSGGMIMNRFLGWHPSAYVGLFGVNDSPHDMARKAGTRVIHADANYELGNGLQFGLGWWMQADSGYTLVDFSNLDNITPPFGYARSEFAAQVRSGQMLGNEFNLTTSYNVGEHINVYASGGYMLTGAFYSTEIDRVAGTALGSPTPANPWALMAGTRLSF